MNMSVRMCLFPANHEASEVAICRVRVRSAPHAVRSERLLARERVGPEGATHRIEVLPGARMFLGFALRKSSPSSRRGRERHRRTHFWGGARVAPRIGAADSRDKVV